MAKVRKDYDHGAGSDLSNGGVGYPSLGSVLRDIITDLTGLNPGVPAWSASTPVTTNTVTLATAGTIISVYGLTGTTTGPKQLIPTGTPLTGQAKVTYDAKGIPTILFATADAISAAQFQQDKRPASFTLLSILG
jgi:hypothetical protein